MGDSQHLVILSFGHDDGVAGSLWVSQLLVLIASRLAEPLH